MRRAFRARGVEAWSCDILPSRDASPFHLQCDIFEALASRRWGGAIFHPPCDHLAVSGARWFPEKRADGRQQAAIDFALRLWNADVEFGIKKIALENPVSILSRHLPCKAKQIVQPWWFGHPETKTTCLWLKGLPRLTKTNEVEPDYMRRADGSYYTDKKGKRYSRIHFMSGRKNSDDRKRARSETYAGLAEAMASQWGG